MNNLTKNIATEAVQDAKLEASFYGSKITPALIAASISCAFAMNEIQFENSTAEFFLETAVLKEIKASFPAVYAEAWPAVGMDQNGNYTTDSSKWA